MANQETFSMLLLTKPETNCSKFDLCTKEKKKVNYLSFLEILGDITCGKISMILLEITLKFPQWHVTLF
jgi:hypothetical protein